jgi:hypothetical protein
MAKVNLVADTKESKVIHHTFTRKLDSFIVEAINMVTTLGLVKVIAWV